jgi:tRNA pseudouridine38-40 synthase
MPRSLVAFGYDGAPFAGWARQPGRRTVEGEILLGVVRVGVAASEAGARISVASRTDRGVSARQNALALSSPLAGRALLRALNGIAPEIFFAATREVPEEFRVRSARAREYRYFLGDLGRTRERWEEALAWFVGGDIDVRSFARGLPSERPTWRTLERLELVPGPGPGPEVLRVRGPGFVWGMVRKIVAAVRAYAEGKVRAVDIREALRGERRLAVPLAPPEPLVLWSVEYPDPWAVHEGRRTRRQIEHFRGEADRARARAHWAPLLLGAVGDPGDPPD